MWTEAHFSGSEVRGLSNEGMACNNTILAGITRVHGKDTEFHFHIVQVIKHTPCGWPTDGAEVLLLSADIPPLLLNPPLVLPERPCGISRVPLLRLLVWLLSVGGP